MGSQAQQRWEKDLGPFGARAEDIVVLDESADPTHRIQYLDLFRGAANDSRGLWPSAIVEFQGKPILYVVDHLAAARSSPEALVHLRRVLAFRAGADHVALSAPGRLTVLPVTPTSKEELKDNTRTVVKDGDDAPGFMAALAFPPLFPDETKKSAKDYAAVAVHNLLYDLLTDTTRELTKQNIAHLDALSLVGRALFVRFLVDRGVLGDRDIEKICGFSTAHCFASKSGAAKISQWLDETFNGDFLPLPLAGSERWFQKLSPTVFAELTKILSRATSTGQLHFTWGDGWNDLLFDHIPVGLLSQVYEDHAHNFDPVIAKKTSVKYTPRHIAEYMVDEVFFALGERAHEARVLDPAVGGGVFLVAAFRRLAAESWRIEGMPPGTKKLREILYKNLRGFDISQQALRLCSLGLYLTAVELDPKPTPIKGLRFDRPLIGEVLLDVSSPNPREKYTGSLREEVVTEPDDRYDVVIGNPPWTSWAQTDEISDDDIKTQVASVERKVKEIVRDRLGDEEARRYTMVDRNPDLPFLWRAMEWAKEGGHIALTLHGRFLFKQSESGKTARESIFRALTVDGVLNGAALRSTEYWPNVSAPFCLFFARNRRPSAEDSFWFVSPVLEKSINDQGKLRIDEMNAVPVDNRAVLENPWTLKALFRGTMLDVRVVEQMKRVAPESLLTYWNKQFSMVKRCGEGFIVGGDGPKSQPKKSAQKIVGLPMLERAPGLPFLIQVEDSRLPVVPEGMTMQRPRSRTIYEHPLVLVPESLPVDRRSPTAHLCLEDLAYSQSFTGFSCKEESQGGRLARYLFLLLNSNIVSYHALMTGGRFGLERDTMLVDDLYELPFRPLENLPAAILQKVEPLSDALIQHGSPVLDDVDAFAAEVYGLSRADREVITDTLDIALPFAHSRAKAQSRPDKLEIDKYIDRVQGIIAPFLEKRGRCLTIRVVRNAVTDLWIVLQLDSHEKGQRLGALREDNAALAALVNAADSLAATRIIAVDSPTTLLIGLVAQYRYFTPSRARLLAVDLLQEHAGLLEGKTSA